LRSSSLSISIAGTSRGEGIEGEGTQGEVYGALVGFRQLQIGDAGGLELPQEGLRGGAEAL
jgi:hypothetical protein